MYEYCDTFKNTGASGRMTATERQFAWSALTSICKSANDLDAGVKLRDGVIRPGQLTAGYPYRCERKIPTQKVTTSEEDTRMRCVPEHAQTKTSEVEKPMTGAERRKVTSKLSENELKMQWYFAPGTSPVKLSPADQRITDAAAKLKAVEDKLKAAEEKLSQQKNTEKVAETKVVTEQKSEVAEISAEDFDDCESVEESEIEEETLESEDKEMAQFAKCAPHCVLIFISHVFYRVLEPADASILSFGAWLQFAGLLALLASIAANRSVEGLRVATMERLAAAAVLRLMAAGGGYFPAGEYDTLYLIGDAGTLIIATVIIALMCTTYKSTCAPDRSSLQRGIVAMLCIGFVVGVHGDLGDSVVLDMIWMTALCADTVALVPQVDAMLNGSKSISLSCAAGLIVSRACAFAFWYEASAELSAVVATCSITAHAAQLLLACSLVTGRFLKKSKPNVIRASSVKIGCSSVKNDYLTRTMRSAAALDNSGTLRRKVRMAA